MRRALLGHYALIVIAVVLLAGNQVAQAATYRTANFVVNASTPEIAEQVAKCAEYWRAELAVAWFGQELRNWYHPCPIQVRVGQLAASGQTTFTFQNGEVNSWQMEVNGTLERVLDSVVPHEVNHTIFASHFRRPLPRWADEGAATLFEHESEQNIQKQLLLQVIQTPRKIPLKTLFNIREYPTDHRDVLTLYSEGFSLATFLVGMKGAEGRRTYLQLLQDAHQTNWEAAIVKNYGFQSVDELDRVWTDWVLKGSQPFEAPTTLAANSAQSESASMASPETIFRSQSPQGNQSAGTTQPAGLAAAVTSTLPIDTASGISARGTAGVVQAGETQTTLVGTLAPTTRTLKDSNRDPLAGMEIFNFQPQHNRTPVRQSVSHADVETSPRESRDQPRFVPTRESYHTQVNGPQFAFPAARQ